MDVEAPLLPDFARYRVEPDERFSLSEHDPGDTGELAGEEEVEREYDSLGEQISDLQERLFAEERRSLLLVLHISKAEQLEKFRERLERPDKYWKWSDNAVPGAAGGRQALRGGGARARELRRAPAWLPGVTIPGEASVRLAATREQWSRRSMNARPGQ
jgi:hypothetical protein